MSTRKERPSLSKETPKSSLCASKTCEQAKPEEYRTPDQEQDGQLNDDSVCIARQEKEEETTKQHGKANAHESTKSMLEGLLRYELAADLAGRTLQVLPAEALITSWTNGARHRTACRLAVAFGHHLAAFFIWKVFLSLVSSLLLPPAPPPAPAAPPAHTRTQ